MANLYGGKCSNGHLVKVSYEETFEVLSLPGRRQAHCPCGNDVFAKMFDIETTETKCGGRCESATNLKCHCSCGGENHGKHKVAFGAV